MGLDSLSSYSSPSFLHLQEGNGNSQASAANATNSKGRWSYFKEKISIVNEKISNLFKSRTENDPMIPKEMVIHHLGGTRVASVDNSNTQVQLARNHYFHEGIPVKTKTGEIFIYGSVLKPHVEKWIKETESGRTQLTFQDYLSGQFDTDQELKDSIIKQQVRYFDDTDREKTQISIENGKLMQIGLDNDTPGLKPLPTGSYAFVVATVDDGLGKIERKFFATPKIKTEAGKIQHSSFMRGGNVLAAGMLDINEHNQVIGIRNQSGHYKPTGKELAQLVKHLIEAGFDTSKLFVTCYKNELGKFFGRFGLPWGIVTQPAERWFDQTGKKLLE